MVLLAILTVPCFVFGLAACSGNQRENDTGNSDIEQGNDDIKSPDSYISGEFYTLQEAYDSGYLTREDLLSIAYYHNGGITENEELISHDFTPKQKNSEGISELIKNSIINLYKTTYLSDLKDVSNKDIIIDQYYGTYNATVALQISDQFSGIPGIVYVNTVANVNFIIKGREPIIWKEKI